MDVNVVLWVLGVGLVVVNGLVSFGLIRSIRYSRTQKLGQLAMIWFLPVLGASFIGYFLNEPVGQARKNPLADRAGHGDGGGDYARPEPSCTGADSSDSGGDGD